MITLKDAEITPNGNAVNLAVRDSTGEEQVAVATRGRRTWPSLVIILNATTECDDWAVDPVPVPG
jgi:hypothetical protein